MQNILANNTFTYDFDDVYMVWENMQISVQKVRMNIEIFELINDDIYKRRFEVQTQRAHNIKTVEKALLSNKFEVLGIYHEFSKLPPTKESQRVFFAAKAKK